MRRDAFLVRELPGAGVSGMLLRAHGWTQPCLTLGRSQELAEQQREQLARAGVEVARRPTGGGWLLHLPGDLALTLVRSSALRAGELRGAAALLSDAIASGFAASGIRATVAPRSVSGGDRAQICFARTDREEVHVGPTKVAGVAIARVGRAAVVQAAIPLVAVTEKLAAIACRWDPLRGAAATVSGAADPLALRYAVIAQLERRTGRSSRPWFWPSEWLQRLQVVDLPAAAGPEQTAGAADQGDEVQ